MRFISQHAHRFNRTAVAHSVPPYAVRWRPLPRFVTSVIISQSSTSPQESLSCRDRARTMRRTCHSTRSCLLPSPALTESRNKSRHASHCLKRKFLYLVVIICDCKQMLCYVTLLGGWPLCSTAAIKSSSASSCGLQATLHYAYDCCGVNPTS